MDTIAAFIAPGYGDGSGYGSGNGYGSGYGISSFCGQPVYQIDCQPTIITKVAGSAAKGYLLQSDE